MDIKKKLLAVLMALSILLVGVGAHAIVKPELSVLGARKGTVGDFQQNISLSGNINPYLNQNADKQLQVVKPPLRDSVLVSQAPEPCHRTKNCGSDLDVDKGSTTPDSDQGSTMPDSDQGLRQG